MRMNSRVWISLIAMLFLATACGSDGGDGGGGNDGGGGGGRDAGRDADIPDALPDAAPPSGHLLISEVSVRDNNAEFIEIYNPTGVTVELDDYYIADDHEYYLLPAVLGGHNLLPNFSLTDFIARFPAGSTIAAGETAIIAINYSNYKVGFTLEEFEPQFSLSDTPGDDDTPPAGTLMLDPGQGAPTPVQLLNTDAVPGVDPLDPNLANNGEAIVLFRWDGVSDLVTDVDMLHAGNPPLQVNRFDSKAGKLVDGPDADDLKSAYQNEGRIIAIPNVPQTGDPVSFHRAAFEVDEVTTGGNGVDGHDETSEDTSQSFPQRFYASPTPGIIHPGLRRNP